MSVFEIGFNWFGVRHARNVNTIRLKCTPSIKIIDLPMNKAPLGYGNSVRNIYFIIYCASETVAAGEKWAIGCGIGEALRLTLLKCTDSQPTNMRLCNDLFKPIAMITQLQKLYWGP